MALYRACVAVSYIGPFQTILSLVYHEIRKFSQEPGVVIGASSIFGGIMFLFSIKKIVIMAPNCF